MESARDTLQKLVAGVLNRLPAEQVPVEAWQFVCGKQVAGRTQALGFADGVLRVEVPDAGWQTQLQDLSARYLASLNQYSATRVERIEFVLAGSPPVQPVGGERKPRTARPAARRPKKSAR